MIHPESDAIVVHGGGVTPEGTLPTKAAARADVGIQLWHDTVAPWLVFTGNHSFTQADQPPVTEAAAGKMYAAGQGIPIDSILTEEESLETVGNALFTKTRLAIPRDWGRLTVVTSHSHLARTLEIYDHVFGGDYQINGVPSPEEVGIRERVWERAGGALVNEVLRGTKPGDHQAIRERLFALVPGYATDSKATMGRLALRSLRGLLG